MKKTLKRTFAIGAATILSVSLFTGCGQTKNGNSEENRSVKKIAGTILLSVNPEIEVNYDYDGNVVKIEGMNDDGKSTVEKYSDYAGKECDEVVSELVEEIYEAGYFEQKVGGREKNIVLKLEEGSEYPNAEFLETVAQGVRDAVKKYNITSAPMTIEKDDVGKDGYLTLEKAKELVLGQLGFDEADFTEKTYKLDDGVYELEFTNGGVKYEYEVDAVTGKVQEADYDQNDDWDDADDDADDADDDMDDDDDVDDADDDSDDIYDTDDDYDDIYNTDDDADDDMDDDDVDDADDDSDDDLDDGLDDSDED